MMFQSYGDKRKTGLFSLHVTIFILGVAIVILSCMLYKSNEKIEEAQQHTAELLALSLYNNGEGTSEAKPILSNDALTSNVVPDLSGYIIDQKLQAQLQSATSNNEKMSFISDATEEWQLLMAEYLTAFQKDDHCNMLIYEKSINDALKESQEKWCEYFEEMMCRERTLMHAIYGSGSALASACAMYEYMLYRNRVVELYEVALMIGLAAEVDPALALQ